jgi:signal transduction histidine kinase
MRRGSVRLRLTLLFGGLFLAAGAALLAITYGLVSHATNDIFVARQVAGGGAGPTVLPDIAGLQAQALGNASAARAKENDALLLYSGIALAIMMVVSVGLGWFAAGHALRPLRRITAGARRIAATNLHERLAVAGPDDDLRELADTIDGLFARLDASFDAQRQFIANASHELRTPLARSRTLLEVALRDPDATAASLRAACERVLAAGAEQERLIEALLMLARGQRGIARREPLDLAAITRDVLAARGTEVAGRGLGMEVTLAPALMAGDTALSERAVANLIDNALRHNVADGTVWISVGTDDDRVVLSVANTGPVIAPAEVDSLLLPFRRGGALRSSRTAPPTASADGLGLGLSIVQAVATAHGASFGIAARPGGGLAAELSFPAANLAWHGLADRTGPAVLPAAEPDECHMQLVIGSWTAHSSRLLGAGAEFRPEGAVGAGGRTARGEDGHRRTLHRHALDHGKSGDRCGSHLRSLRREILCYFVVQLFAAIDHGEERQYVRAVAVEAGDEFSELIQSPHRQRGRDQRDEDHVGRVQHVLRDQRDARRAVEEDRVVLVSERCKQLAQLARRLAAGPVRA